MNGASVTSAATAMTPMATTPLTNANTPSTSVES